MMDHPEPQHVPRRRADQDLADYAVTTLAWVRRGPRILVLLFGLSSGAAAVAAWLGAQSASPAQRIARVEHRVDSGFLAIDSAMSGLRTQAALLRAERGAIDEKLDLLLRLGCPTISRADLIKACRDQGAIH